MGTDVHDSEPFNNTEQAPDLNALVAKWRWLVPDEISVHAIWGEPSDGAVAEACPTIDLLRILIRVAPADYAPDSYGEFGITRDVEADLVHELLHWRHAGFRPKQRTAEHALWEACVERTAQDLIRMDRGQ